MGWTAAFYKETKVSYAPLRRVGNPPSNIKANAGLTVPLKAWGADSKEGLM